jgi:hypothetical protein
VPIMVPPVAPTATSFTAASSAVLLSVTYLSTAAFTVASFTVTSSAVLLSAASLSTAAFSMASSVALFTVASFAPHVSHGSSSRHQASRQLRDRHVPPGLQLPPPGLRQLQNCHVSHGRALQAVSY